MAVPPSSSRPRNSGKGQVSDVSATTSQGPSGVMKISLHRKTPSLGQYQTTSIDKHFALNKQILVAFEEHYRNRKTKTVAFFLGVNFLETALLQIPQHGYFYSTKAADDRQISTRDALRVLHRLQSLMVEDPSINKERFRIEKLTSLAEKLESLEPTPDKTKYEPLRLAVESELNRLYPSKTTKSRKGQSKGNSFLRRAASNNKKMDGKPSSNKRTTSEPPPPSQSSFVDCDVLACGESLSAIFCPGSYGHDPSVAPVDSLRFPPQQQQQQVGAPMQPKLPNVDNGRYPDPTNESLLLRSHGDRTSDQSVFPPRNISNRIIDEANTTNNIEYPPTTQSSSVSVPSDSRRPPMPDYDDMFPPHTSSTSRSGTSRSEYETKEQVVVGSAVQTGVPINYRNPPRREEKDSNTKSYGIQTGVPLSRGPPGHPSSWSSSSPFVDHKPDLQRALYLSGLEVMPNDNNIDGNITTNGLAADNHPGGVNAIGGYPDIMNESNIVREKEHVVQAIEERDAAPVETDRLSLDNTTISANSNIQANRVTTAGINDMDNRRSSSGLTLDLLKLCYKEDFESLLDDNRVVISEVPTYQGRVEGSTNGCTVIAPLMCIHHFHSDSKSLVQGVTIDNGLSDDEIVHVIDNEVPSILPAIRRKLGLSQDAFLIPVDANDALMEQQLLCSENFCNVFGGNILEDSHLDPFLEQMSKVGGKKLAATFFFHEHVISIMQLRRPTGVWFDFVDSLPRSSTVLREQISGRSSDRGRSTSASPSSSRDSSFTVRTPEENQEWKLLSERSRLMEDAQLASRGMMSTRTAGGRPMSDSSGTESDWDEAEVQRALIESCSMNASAPQNAARIRCMDVEALKTTIKWYASNAFSAENFTYIDTYQWDERQCDFDPRVFQAFVWTEV